MKYIKAINGTIEAAIVDILFIPPMITRATNKLITIEVIKGSIPKLDSMVLEILLLSVLLTARSVEEATRVLFTYISSTRVLPSGHFLEEAQYQVVITMTISVIPFHLITKEIESLLVFLEMMTGGQIGDLSLSINTMLLLMRGITLARLSENKTVVTLALV